MNWLFLLASLLAHPATAAQTSKLRDPTCAASGCHADLKAFPRLHKPMRSNGCPVCHEPGQGGLKVPAKHPRLLPIAKKDVNELCLTCHDDMARPLKKSAVVHKPLTEKSCVACHDPHGSSHPKLVKERAEMELCLSCHKDMGEALRSASYPHSAVRDKKGCLNCHEHHFAAEKKLLKGKTADLCLSCHDKEITTADGRKIKDMKSFLAGNRHKHNPAKAGKCAACHNPHGSPHRALLIKNLSEQTYAGDAKAFELCFKCHETDLQELETVQEGSKAQTDFRNGTKNMHYLHLHARKRARSCLVCHDAHASPNDKVIKDTLTYEGVTLPMGFRKTDSGGTCMNACHKPKEYSQDKEVENSAGR